MPLTDVAIRNAKPREKPYKMGDALGLFLLVQPTGAKLWRLKYRIHGREKKVALGKYPEIGLADARNRTREAREQLAHGLDPGREKQKAKLRAHLEANNSFSAIAKEYCEKRKRDGAKAWAPATSRRCEYLLSLLSGSIGKLPITDIEPIDVLEAVRRIERQGKHESSRRTMQLAGAVFRYAVATARVRSDPTRDLRGALIAPTVTHYGAIIDPERVGPLMRAIDEYDGQPITRLALQLAPHVFVRPGELRHAEWHEFDLEGALWTIPADKTKMRKDLRSHCRRRDRDRQAGMRNSRADRKSQGAHRQAALSAHHLIQPACRMTMHPDLLQAIILAAIVKMPEATKKQLTSSVQAKRERAEELLAASVLVAIQQRR